MSYEDATDFCRRLTEEETKAGRLAAGMHYQLPTEAQWEYACCAGTTTLSAPGDQLSSNDANFDGTVPQTGAAPGPYLHETTPVGQYRANPWGVHDMHGNVWELCLDGYQAKLAGGEDPVGPASAKFYVMRGGCWHNNDRHVPARQQGLFPAGRPWVGPGLSRLLGAVWLQGRQVDSSCLASEVSASLPRALALRVSVCVRARKRL